MFMYSKHVRLRSLWTDLYTGEIVGGQPISPESLRQDEVPGGTKPQLH